MIVDRIAPALHPLGWLILALAIALSALGILGVYASESGIEGPPKLTLKQVGFLAVGLGGLAGIQIVGHRAVGRWAYLLAGVTLVLLILLVVARKWSLEPIIRARRNTYRWIELGFFSFQVSEFAKVVYILALAWYLRFRTNYRSFMGLMVPFVLTLIPVALILKEPDLGTSLLLPPVLLLMIFAAGARVKHLTIVVLMAASAAPLFYVSPLMSEYQRDRLRVVARQNSQDVRWRMNIGYQLSQSKTALGSGQFFGRGVDEGAFFRHKLLPEDHNDFIFAVLGHQWGFFGCTLVILCYVALIAAGLTLATIVTDPFGRLVAVGVCALIGVQMIINVGMTIGLMPITGMTLPFVSMGGSALIANYLAIGLLISVGRRQPLELAPKPFEFPEEEE